MKRTARGRTAAERAAARQRLLAFAGYGARSAAWAGLLTALYYVIPLDSGFGPLTVLTLGFGLVLFGLVVVWQVAAITHARYPRLRAIEALAIAVPLFLLLFSATYFLFAKEVPQSFSEPLSRTDALYFTVTVFATVGFGDIVPDTEGARALLTGQMVADLIVVGVIAKALFGAVQVGVSRRASAAPGGGGDGAGGSSAGGAERK